MCVCMLLHVYVHVYIYACVCVQVHSNFQMTKLMKIVARKYKDL